jgi:hypothetical protein
MPERSYSAPRQRTWPPVVIAMLLQALAAALTAATARLLLAPLQMVLPLLGAAMLCGTYAAALSGAAGLARWWMLIQFGFAPLLLLVSELRVPSAVWIVLFVFFVAVYWSTFRTQVPLYLSSTRVREALLTLLPPGRFTFIDIGSGVGGVLLDLADARADGSYHGIESAPFPWLVSWVRIVFAGRRTRCRVRWGSFWNTDLSQYDVVFAYLSPVPMAALWEKVQNEMRPGSRFISNTFVVQTREPSQTLQVEDLHDSTLYMWIIG